MKNEAAALGREQRLYIRLDSVFPVQWRLLNEGGNQVLCNTQVGFTSNISKGGICLSVRNLPPELTDILSAGKGVFSLEMEMPFYGKPISALARISWVRHLSHDPGKYLVGLEYSHINPVLNARMVTFAYIKALFAPAALILVAVLAGAFWLNISLNRTLVQQNKQLVEELVKTAQEVNRVREESSSIASERGELKGKISALQAKLEALAQRPAAATEQAPAEGDLASQVVQLTAQRNDLQERLASLEYKDAQVVNNLQRLENAKSLLQKATSDKMYQWLAVHQNPRTGLVMSFEGDGAVAEWAFVYDQSLACQAYLLFNDHDRAKKVLTFFSRSAERSRGLFFNAYYAKEGTPAEYTVHAGPNLWLGIAAAQYTRKTGDTAFLPLAEEVAAGILRLQAEDPEGGVRGGPDTAWFATEHNLDAYAFYQMLYQLTAKPQYAQARDRVLAWLKLHAYDKPNVPISRGKGDATIATDTYAWSIASIGPEKLNREGMDPDGIISFAEKECAVEVNYLRPEGVRVRVKGFDFAPRQHVGRGGVVSPEWTAQMVLSYKILSRYYRDKGDTARQKGYEAKAEEYLNSLAKMVISSPSPTGQGQGCLPYATEESVETGHGWVTPKGNSTGSIAGTAYTLFALSSYNPLELQN